jgi:hypothetical protein
METERGSFIRRSLDEIMGSYTNCVYHIIFAAKYGKPLLRMGFREDAYSMIFNSIPPDCFTTSSLGDASNSSVSTDGYDGETPQAACLPAVDVFRHRAR